MELRETHSIGARTREWIVHPRDCPPLASHRIGLAGYSEARQGFRFVRRKPDMSQLLVCYRGQGRVLADGAWQTCGTGQAYLTPPHALHAYEALPNLRWDVCWVMYLETGDVKPVVDAGAPVLVSLDPRPLRGAIEGLYVETVGGADLRVMNHWVELIQMLVGRVLQPYRSDDRLWHLWAAVDADVARAWTLDDLSRVACLSGEHLRRLTHKQYGRSPMEQVTWLRMRKAAALLASTPHKIETVGRAVGYENPFAFSTAFKRCMGKSPSAYRQTDPR